MQLEDYLDFSTPDDIRLRGHRIAIEDILYYYLDGYTTEEIAANLPTLSLEQIHATITYYLHNRADIDAYLARLGAWQEANYRVWAAKPSPVVQRLRMLKAQREEAQLTPA